MFALIHNNRVISTKNKSFSVPEKYRLVQCADDLTAGSFYENGHFIVLAGPAFEELKAPKLEELNKAFNASPKSLYCMSSTGFEVNADETANRNISSLIYVLENTGDKTVPFCAYDNSFHDVTLEQLKTMKLGIIAHARSMYQLKWALRKKINAAASFDELNAVVTGFEQTENNISVEGFH